MVGFACAPAFRRSLTPTDQVLINLHTFYSKNIFKRFSFRSKLLRLELNPSGLHLSQRAVRLHQISNLCSHQQKGCTDLIFVGLYVVSIFLQASCSATQIQHKLDELPNFQFIIRLLIILSNSSMVRLARFELATP